MGIRSAFGGVGGFGQELLRAGAHGAVNGLSNQLSGGSFGSGFLSGAVSSGFGSAFNGATGLEAYIGGGLAGGFGSLAGGGNFLTGVGQGLVTTALNHQSHCPTCPTVGEIKSSVHAENIPTVKASAPLPPALSGGIQAAGWIGTGLTAGGSIQSNNGKWLGKNGKYYSTSWGGNGYTGGRNYIQYSSRVLKASGTAFGIPSVAYNFSEFLSAYNIGNSSAAKVALAETASSGIGAFGGVPGIGWAIGWEGGRYITGRTGYQRWKYNKWLPFRKRTFGY